MDRPHPVRPVVGAHRRRGVSALEVVVTELEEEMLACLKAIAGNEHVMHWGIGQALNARIRRVIKKAEGDA